MATPMPFPTGYGPLDRFMTDVVWKRCPGVRVYYKNSSKLMHFLYYVAFMWIWQRRFFHFHTTIGKGIYIVDDTIKYKRWKAIYSTMRHEFVHVLQRMKWKLLYDISYLFPQVLFVLSVLAVLDPLFGVQVSKYCLISLAFLAPLPAPWRMKWELEAYTETLATWLKVFGNIGDNDIRMIAGNFTSKSYYFMWPFRRFILKRLTRICTKLKIGAIKGPIRDIYS